MLRWLFVALLAPACFGAGWTEYRSGPFQVISDAGDRAARDRLTEMEQLRHALGAALGKENLQTVWPVQLVLFANQRDYAPYALPQPFVDGGSATLAAWFANGNSPPPHGWFRELTRILIEDNAGRMPPEVETALCDLFSTIQVNATRVSIGAPPAQGELPADRIGPWAKLQMLATQPDFSGRLHVFLSNLQQGADEDVAARNSFDLTKAELDQRAGDYLRAGKFAPASVSGLAISPSRDFVEAQIPQSAIDPLLAELEARGKRFPPESPRGLLAEGTRPALEQAAAANPKWAEPHVKLAALQTDPAAKVKELKAAAALQPRNSAYWEALAQAQAAAEQYAEAEKSWVMAERSAASQQERERLHKSRVGLEEERAAFEIAEKKRLAAERAAELQRIKDSAAAEVHAAEAAANARMGGLKSGQTPVAWWSDANGQKLSATLIRVDCLAQSLRLTLQPASGAPMKLLIRDPAKLAVKGAGEAQFACGVQKPARKIDLVHDGKPDARLGTAGDILSVEFP